MRAQALAEGTRLGWRPFGEAVGVDGETLRAFAKAPPGRRVHPATAAALRRYFRPSLLPAEVMADLRTAMEHARVTLETLERLTSAADVEEVKRTGKAALVRTPPAAESTHRGIGRAAPDIADAPADTATE